MKTIFTTIFLSLLLFACNKELNPDINLQGNGRLKTVRGYISTAASVPFVTKAYTYDPNGNILKIQISDYREYAYYAYEYDENGVLLNKKYKAIDGPSEANYTESDFALMLEYKYSYVGNRKIEKEYIRNVLNDSAIYTYTDELLISEDHYMADSDNFSILYQYDADGNLIRRTQFPDGSYTAYEYYQSRLDKTENHDKDGMLTVTDFYYYKTSGNQVIIEVQHQNQSGKFLSQKFIYNNGNKTFFVQYHPEIIGEELFCERYDYF
jgi:hypothetical protein